LLLGLAWESGLASGVAKVPRKPRARVMPTGKVRRKPKARAKAQLRGLVKVNLEE
jgi:hypothetical protein